MNISPGLFADELLPDLVATLLTRYHVPAHRLTVEITEQRCVCDPTGVAVALARLSRSGVRLSLDDFGTGDSTLARLRELDFDEIKIDRCFITSLTESRTDEVIVTFITDLAHKLGCRVVAEGIEETPALTLLEALGVDSGQGFLLHRPEPDPALDIGPADPL